MRRFFWIVIRFVFNLVNSDHLVIYYAIDRQFFQPNEKCISNTWRANYAVSHRCAVSISSCFIVAFTGRIILRWKYRWLKSFFFFFFQCINYSGVTNVNNNDGFIFSDKNFSVADKFEQHIFVDLYCDRIAFYDVCLVIKACFVVLVVVVCIFLNLFIRSIERSGTFEHLEKGHW